MFAVQALVACIGADVVQTRIDQLASFPIPALPTAASTNNDDSAMVVDPSSSVPPQPSAVTPHPPPAVTIKQAIESFDMGVSFRGAFQTCPTFSPGNDMPYLYICISFCLYSRFLLYTKP